ncbi:MAG: hypothetical protein ACRDNZ_15620 [Streptosporangiaceae bacterium]
MCDDSPPTPAIVRHYAAILAAWSHATPEISVQGSRAELRLSLGSKMFVAIFACRKNNWSARGIEIRNGERTAAFARGELTRALAVLLGHEPLATAPQAVKASSPGASATIRERRTTVIRV